MIHSSITVVHCFDNCNVGKQPVAWEEYCAEYWLKEFQESMDRCTGRHDRTEILLKTAFNSIQSIVSSKYALNISETTREQALPAEHIAIIVQTYRFLK